MLLLSPSAPCLLYPQHFAVPVSSVAQVYKPPAVICVTPVRPVTSTGVLRLVVLLSPSWPFVFRPQHFAVPVSSVAHVNCHPPVIWVTLGATVGLLVGPVDGLVVGDAVVGLLVGARVVGLLLGRVVGLLLGETVGLLVGGTIHIFGPVLLKSHLPFCLQSMVSER